MKICAIRDEYANKKEIGYLFYFEKSRIFSIELEDSVSEQDVPVFLASFVRKGIRTLDPEWSRRWVRQRIIPEERQNLGIILRENHLQMYDEYRLLILGSGRCAQDDCMVLPVKKAQLPTWMQKRTGKKLAFALPLSSQHILAGYNDGTLRKTDLMPLIKSGRSQMLLAKPELIQDFEMLPGGMGITWSGETFLMAEQLYDEGELLSVSTEQFTRAVSEYVMDTGDVCAELNCSRQYVNSLVVKNELSVLKESGNNRIYEKSAVNRLKD